MVPRILTTVLALALLSGAASAQYCYAENAGNTFANNISMGGPNLLLGIKFTAPANLSVSAIDVFTGEQTGTNSIAIWTHNPTLNQPGSSLGTASWAMVSTNSWQGATLPSPVSLSSGMIYWVVWGCQNGAQASVDLPGPSAVIQTYRGSFDGGQSWNGPWLFNDRPWKFGFTCVAGGYQVNQPRASLTANGVQSTGFQPAITTVPWGSPTLIAFGGLAGAPWDMGYTVSANLVASNFVTTNGQIVNLDFTHPSFGWAFGGTFQTSFFPFAGLVSFPAPGMQINAQMVLLSTIHPDGFYLSQAISVQTQ